MRRLKLTIDSPDRDGERELLIERFPFRLGRALDNDLPILCPSVSGHHLQIESDGEAVCITDMGSTNGTRLEGMTLPVKKPQPVDFPAQLEIGDVELQLDAATPDETVFTMAESATRLREMVDEVVRQSNANDQTRPFFEILSGPGSGRRFFLQPDGTETAIGTDDEADIFLDLPELPPRLGTVVWEGTRCRLISDVEALRHNDAPFEERRLHSGDQFVVGAVELLFYDPLEDALDALGGDDNRKAMPTTLDDDKPVSDDEASSENKPTLPVQPRKNSADSGDTAPVVKNDDGPAASWGAVEIFLLTMSAVFLVGTLVLFFILFST